jgi:hypothetical protein
MRWLVLVPFLARGVAACVDYPHNSIPSVAPSATPADKIGVPAADRLLLERVRFRGSMGGGIDLKAPHEL